MEKKKKHTSALDEKEGVPQSPSVGPKAVDRLKKSRKKILDVQTLFEGIRAGDPASLSRGITLIESTASRHTQRATALIEACLPHAQHSVRIGITGVPGVGKSTFIEQLGLQLTEAGQKVAVLAVDPSSTVSKGSILGDKTRMEQLVQQPNAFIRPSASGDSLGGVARKTREAIILCEAAGYNHIIIETVGVGQSETAVHSMTDFFLLLKLAGAGDELQGIKRGIVEMADAIVINKADGDNVKAARLAKTEFNRALHLYPPKDSGWSPKTMVCSALKQQGISEVWEMIEGYMNQTKANGYFEQKRSEQDAYWLLQTIETTLKGRFFNHPTIKRELEAQLEAIRKNETTPFAAAAYLLNLDLE